MAEKSMKWVRLNQAWDPMSVSKRQALILEALKEHTAPEIRLTEASALAKTTTATLQKMATAGLLEIFDAVQHRDQAPLLFYTQSQVLAPLELNIEQEHVY